MVDRPKSKVKVRCGEGHDQIFFDLLISKHFLLLDLAQRLTENLHSKLLTFLFK